MPRSPASPERKPVRQRSRQPTVREAISRLEAMIEPRQQTWDLSPNDVDAIRMTLAYIEQLELANAD